MKILYGQAWDNDELTSLKPVVFANIIQNMRLVLEYANTNGVDLGDMAENAKMVIGLGDDTDVGQNGVGQIIKALWLSPQIQEVWEKRSNFQVLDCLSYYCNDLDRICAPSYIPTQQDVLQARVRTSGIVEEKYVIDGVQFTMFDVGGQRNERKKWIHAFDNVTAVIFVAAISEYDQVLYEDSQTNRIEEAIKLFDEICNSSWFSKTSMILFLNKNDLFVAKLKHTPLRIPGVRYDDFAGPYADDPSVDFNDAVEAAHKYMTNLFVSRKRDTAREVYAHVTEATDTKQVHVVFNACKDIILRRNLTSSGFMD
jgi:hypothetical protein